MPERYEVIVIGVGAMGSAACYRLAKRGVRVLGIDRYSIPNTLGSSHGQSRMIRMCYYEHPDYVPLLKRAYELWHETEHESGAKLLHETGGLYIGPRDGEIVAGSLASALQHHLPHTLLSASDLQVRYPQFTIPSDWVAVYENRAGLLLPERVVEVHAQLAAAAGAALRANEKVIRWREEAGRVTVTTDQTEYQAEQLVFTAGPWSGELLHDLGVTLHVTRQVMAWVSPPRPELFQLGGFPVWAIERADGSLDYGFPMLDSALKLAHHARGSPTDPDTVSRHLLPGDEADFRFALDRYLPAANGPVHETRVCLYTNSPDSHFIVGRHPQHHRVTIACGFSGHGFKFASVMGEALADLAITGATALPISFLGLDRFRR